MINFYAYNKKEKKLKKIEKLEIPEKKDNFYFWIDVQNPSPEEISFIKEAFEMHPTTMEDILSQHTRIKYEEFDEYTFIVLKGISQIKETEIETHNLYFVVGENWLITVHEDGQINNLLENLRRIEGLIKKGHGYIAHYIIDKEIDRYLKIKVDYAEELKQIEKEFMKHPTKKILQDLFAKELTIIELSELTDPSTDLCLSLMKPADNYIDNSLIPYFRDIHDHVFKVQGGLETMLGRINGMKNNYLSITSTRTNETMKVLTIIMAIMMPLTVITGFYGMNVKLPLQNHPFVYIMILGLMILSSYILFFISRKRGWASTKEE